MRNLLELYTFQMPITDVKICSGNNKTICPKGEQPKVYLAVFEL